MKSKIFGIGLPRTGTQSLTQAMIRLGYVSGHCLPPSQWNIIDHYDFVCDSPVPSRFMELDKTFPKSLYIFTTRGIDAWLASCETFFKEKRPPELIKENWILEYRKEIFGTTKYDPKIFAETYYKHFERIRNYFGENKSRLLTIDITNGDGWEKLVDFLGLSIDLKGLGPFPFNDFIKRKKSIWLTKEKKLPAINLLHTSLSSTIDLDKSKVECFPMVRKETKSILKEDLHQIHSIFNKINEFIKENEPLENNDGLLNGKIGLSIYFYILANTTRNKEIQTIAEDLLLEVYHSVRSFITPTNFENGLAGIAWGLCYLIKNDYVEADPDEILGEVDERIYSYWNEKKEILPIDLRQGMLGYLCYNTYRLEITKKHGESKNRNIHTRMVSEIINRIGQLVEEEKFLCSEPETFHIYWELPLLLILLSNSKKLQINSNRIDGIEDYLTPTITSLYPQFHSNRLYLLLGLESILSQTPIAALRSHADLLAKGISLKRIIHEDEESKNLNITAQDGIAGLAFVSRKLSALIVKTELQFPTKEVIKQISRSIDQNYKENFQNVEKNIGLSTGLSGIGILLLEYLNEGRCEKLS